MTAHVAPSPPVAANKQVKSAKLPCQQGGLKQCEVKKLKVTGICKSISDATSVPVLASLVATRRMRGDRIPPATQAKLGRGAVDLLARYDLVIEELAGFPCKGHEANSHGKPKQPGGASAETKSASNVAEIEAEAEFEGKCSVDHHPRIHLKPTQASSSAVEMSPVPLDGKAHMALQEVSWDRGITRVAIKDILAPTFNTDIDGGDNPFAALFQLVMWVWNVNKSADIEVRAEACGVHGPNQAGIGDLNALVRVYRDVSVAIGIAVPPVKKITHTNHAQPEEPPDEFSLYFKFNELEFKLKETLQGVEEQAHRQKQQASESYKNFKSWEGERAKKGAFDRAAREVFGPFLSFRDKLEIFFDGFVKNVRAMVKAIVSVLDLMKKFPQLGFTITFEVGFLSGDAFLQWSHAPADTSQARSGPLAARYAPLAHKLHFNTTLSIVTFSVEASFGLMISCGDNATAEARVAGKVALDVTLPIDIEFIVGAQVSTKGHLSYKLVGTTTCDLRATLSARLGWFSFKQEIGIESGLVVEGGVDIKPTENAITYSLAVRSLETGWYFHSTNLRTGVPHVSVHKIFDAKLLMAPLTRTVGMS